MKFHLRRITLLSIILVLILLWYYICFKNNLVLCEYNEDNNSNLKDLLSLIKISFTNKIHSEAFRERYMQSYTSQQYYIKVLCHKALIPSFFNEPSLLTVINNNTMSIVDKLDHIDKLFDHYISCWFDVKIKIAIESSHINNITMTDSSIIVLLKEYASLLPISSTKYKLITSDSYLYHFIHNYLQEYPDIQDPKAILVKYYEFVSSTKIDQSLVIINNLIENGPRVVLQNLNWAKECFVLLNLTEVLRDYQRIIEIYNTSQKSIMLLIPYSDIITPGAWSNFENASQPERDLFEWNKWITMLQHATNYIEFLIDGEYLYIKWGLLFQRKVKLSTIKKNMAEFYHKIFTSK